ncbi:MAG TPA: GyrI-like domain-containing protein [Anaerolineae bacterium]
MPQIKHFPKTRVAYVSEMGAMGEAVKHGFDRLFAWVGEQNVQPLGPSIGIFYDDPAKVPAEKQRSDLCVPVGDFVQASGLVQIKDIGDVQVATMVYQGAQNIMTAYNELYDWLHAQGYRDAGAPMETYQSRPGEELRAEVAVPIAKMELLSPPKPARKLAKRAVKKVAPKATTNKPVKRAKNK